MSLCLTGDIGCYSIGCTVEHVYCESECISVFACHRPINCKSVEMSLCLTGDIGCSLDRRYVICYILSIFRDSLHEELTQYWMYSGMSLIWTPLSQSVLNKEVSLIH